MKTISIHTRIRGTIECLVYDRDYDWIVGTFTLVIQKARKGLYVNASIRGAGGKRTGLHRLVFGRHNELLDDQFIDHVDRNPLNNQQSNLRIATRSQNAVNIDRHDSAYRGIYHGTRGWQVRVTKDAQYIDIGVFDDERDAAIAYDIVANEIHGPFGVSNVPDVSVSDVNRVRSLISNPKRYRRTCSSRYLGVHKIDRRWSAWLRVPGTKATTYVGRFDTELEAATARDHYIDEHGLLVHGVRKSLSPRDII